MPIKEIVVHQGPDSRSQVRLRIATTLAKAYDSRLVGVFVRPRPRDRETRWMSFSETARAEWRSNLDAVCNEAEQVFAAQLAREGIEGEWRLMESNVADALMTCARYGDLTVIGQHDPDNPTYPAAMPDQVVLGAGGPVLVVPYAGNFESVGRRVMVAWNGGREAARAARDALPILRRSEVTHVYSINPTGVEHLAGAEISAHLARHGVSAEASRDVLGAGAEAVSSALTSVGRFGAEHGDRVTQSRHAAMSSNDIGDTILSTLADFGADLLVMGAYGHSRVREIVLGGATREIMRSMTVPVLMSC
jgi:nucleotide-binding universal stress UspA family protein